MRLKGKIALITGGTGELGKAVTRKFQNEGADVAVTCRSDADAATFHNIFSNVLTLQGDLTKENDVQRAFDILVKEKGTVDILCNLVGGYMAKTNIADLSEKDWDFMMGLNLKTCFLCSRRALQVMQKSKYGRVVNVSAMAGLSPTAGRGAYGISKSAIIALTRIAGEEAKGITDADITVNAIAPSILLTESNKQSASEEDIARWVTLDEAANLIAFLASSEASAVNGETIPVYGRVS